MNEKVRNIIWVDKKGNVGIREVKERKAEEYMEKGIKIEREYVEEINSTNEKPEILEKNMREVEDHI